MCQAYKADTTACKRYLTQRARVAAVEAASSAWTDPVRCLEGAAWNADPVTEGRWHRERSTEPGMQQAGRSPPRIVEGIFVIFWNDKIS